MIKNSDPANVVRDHTWDAIVIGAGLAGAVAAYLLARGGAKTLLVDAKAFPRAKVCGGCLNTRGVAALESIGLGPALADCSPATISSIELLHAGKRVAFALPAGAGVSRAALDMAIVERAVEAGAVFIDDTRARVLPAVDGEVRHVELLASGKSPRTERAKVVLVCDGLGHPSLRDLPELKPRRAIDSRVGLGAIVKVSNPARLSPPGRIRMVVERDGYVGLALVEHGQLSVAAALDQQALARAASPVALVRGLLARAGLPVDWLADGEPFRGTPPLTQHTPQVSGHRLLLVGDAAGYVEPFTGEGMAAAILGAVAVAPIARAAATEWRPVLGGRWQSEYNSHVRSRQFACRNLAWLLRHPRLLGLAMSGMTIQPALGSAVARWIALPKRAIESSTT